MRRSTIFAASLCAILLDRSPGLAEVAQPTISQAAEVGWAPFSLIEEQPTGDVRKGRPIGQWRLAFHWGAALDEPVDLQIAEIRYRLEPGTVLGRISDFDDRPLPRESREEVYCTHRQWEKKPLDVAILEGELSKADFLYEDWFALCFVDREGDGRFDDAFVSYSRKERMQSLVQLEGIPYRKQTDIPLTGDNRLFLTTETNRKGREVVRLEATSSYEWFNPDYILLACRSGQIERYNMKSNLAELDDGEAARLGALTVAYQGDGSEAGRLNISGSLAGCMISFRNLRWVYIYR